PIAVVAEALECQGGNGYVEESILPRLYREAPLNSIWEGSGNVNALDVLRAMQREPETVAAYFAEVELTQGMDTRLDRAVTDLKKELASSNEIESSARRIVEHMALTLEASLMLRYGDGTAAAIFCNSRLGGEWGHTFGTLSASACLKSVIERHRPRFCARGIDSTNRSNHACLAQLAIGARAAQRT